MNDFKSLMCELQNENKIFKDEWRRWRNGELSRKEKAELNGREPKSVSLARGNFYEALENLFQTKIYPLEGKFRTNPESAVDELIEFLSVNIPAFRCGYAKEFFLTKLKTVHITSDQQKNLQQIALYLCKEYNFPREFRRWCRLMIKLADADFVEKLKELSISKNRYASIKSTWMLKMIFDHRKDLASKAVSHKK